jgi:hypothetical protein
VTIPFLLMRLWTVTPRHIDPQTRISVLYFIQASALRRSAERATENLYRIDGSNVVYRNNLAAALLSERQNPEKALRLTLEIIQEYEEIHYASAINHALALALNRRYEEAMDWMNRIPQEEIQGALKTPYRLAWLEIAFERQDMEAARRHAREIQEDVLMPGDKVWLERVLYELDQDRS